MAKREGLIITQEGIDIQRAPDFKQIYNSTWPILEIYKEVVVNVTVDLSGASNIDLNQSILQHNLGFAPAFQFVDQSGYNGLGTGWRTDSHNFDIMSTPTDIVISGSFFAFELPLNFTVRGHLRVFNYDPKTEFKAPSQPTGDDTAKSRYGIKVLKEAINDLRDSEFSKFSLNSRARSLTIHQSGVMHVGEDNNYTGTIKHDLGYLPSFMVFSPENTFGNGVSGNLTQDIPARQYGDSNQLHFFGVQSVLTGDFPYIIFKDPVLGQAK